MHESHLYHNTMRDLRDIAEMAPLSTEELRALQVRISRAGDMARAIKRFIDRCEDGRFAEGLPRRYLKEMRKALEEYRNC